MLVLLTALLVPASGVAARASASMITASSSRGDVLDEDEPGLRGALRGLLDFRKRRIGRFLYRINFRCRACPPDGNIAGNDAA